MSSTLTCYGWVFIGDPTTAQPEDDHSCISLPGSDRFVATRALTALHRATSPHARVYECNGEVEGAMFRCDTARTLFDGDASEALRLLGRFCARTVASLWTPDPITKMWIETGEERLRAWAHQHAWATSMSLVGAARMAARVTMYASHDQLLAPSTREASRLALHIHRLVSDGAVTRAAGAQERVLATAVLRGVEVAARAIA